MENKISVVMTVYNAEKYIAESIQSILDQTYRDFELLIVDDFSNDKSINIAKQFKDNRIKIFRLKKRHGRTKALNYALNNCLNNFIAIQDADDVSNKNRLLESLNQFKENKELGLVCSEFEIIDKNNILMEKKRNPTELKKFFSKTKYLNLIPHSSITFNRFGISKQKFFYDESFLYAQDFHLILQFLKNSKISLINKKLVKIRHHKENMSNVDEYKK